MHPQPQTYPPLTPPTPYSRHRPIHKAQKTHSHKTNLKRPRNYSTTTRQQGTKRQSRDQIKHCYQSQSNWYDSFQEWLVMQPSVIQQTIQQTLGQFPLLASVDELFSLSTLARLEQNPDMNQVARYSKITSMMDTIHARPLLISGEQVAAVSHLSLDRPLNSPLSCLLMISPAERQMAQKRLAFMEKLKENEAKYDASLGRMSQVSKQLAFTYRTYLQHRNQISAILDSLPSQQTPSFCQEISITQEYTRILISKNLSHALLQSQIDCLNYFKMKECAEANKLDSFQTINSIDELKMFLDKRRPKRGRKQFLATACSVCLSDYCESANPFQTCGVCGLRAHQICFSFLHHKCGYCAYQKVQRQLKQSVEWCFICHQPGLMVVKLSQNSYAHGFCLLIHGYWKFPSVSSQSVSECRPLQGHCETVLEQFLDSSYKSFFFQIEFLSPILNSTTASLPMPDKQLNENVQAQQSQQMDHHQFLGDIGVVQCRQEQEMWKDQQYYAQQGCGCCGLAFYNNCSIKCQHCNKEYHCLCAFLNGFNMKIQERRGWNAFQTNIVLNCCSHDQQKKSWTRKFKLNYGKIVFSNPLCWPKEEELPVHSLDYY